MNQAGTSRPHGAELARELGLFDTTNLVVGTIIGSGIFLVPAEIARAVHTPGWMLGVWVIGGFFTLLGALSLAELGAAMPQAGGIYTFIGRAFGPLMGFLCGWMLFTVATSGSIATLAVALPIYVGGFVALTSVQAKLVSLAAIAVLSWINILGVKNGARVQNALTVLKVGGLVAMVIAIFVMPGMQPDTVSPAPVPLPPGPIGAAAVGTALVAVLWAYEGWHDVSFAAGEIRNPQRNFPLGLIGGVALCVGLYLAANLAYLHVLSPAEIAATPRVALTAMARVTGPWGGKLLTAAILCSILGALNAMMLAGPRAYYQMAKDRMFFERVSRVHPKWRTPVEAIVFQALWASFLILFIGGFSQLFTYVIFGGWIFYGLAVVSVVALRRKDPEMARPFRVPGYPIVPLLFGAAALALVVSTLVATPRESGIGLGFIGLGIPIYYVQKAYRRRGA